jgi:hypothetical protein
MNPLPLLTRFELFFQRVLQQDEDFYNTGSLRCIALICCIPWRYCAILVNYPPVYLQRLY